MLELSQMVVVFQSVILLAEGFREIIGNESRLLQKPVGVVTIFLYDVIQHLTNFSNLFFCFGHNLTSEIVLDVLNLLVPCLCVYGKLELALNARKDKSDLIKESAISFTSEATGVSDCVPLLVCENLDSVNECGGFRFSF